MEKQDISWVLKYLPHRYPFLLIDRVLEYHKDDSLTAIKNVTINEPFFQGHFPGHPVMPGVLIVESMAQACGILSIVSLAQDLGDNGIFYFVGIDNARFKRPVQPGDQMRITAKLTRKMKRIWRFDSAAHVDGELCCSAELMCTYRELVAP